jgi:hypothetical protein
VGRAHSNLILDTRTYEVEFINGQNAELAANVIAHNMFAQCNSKGNTYSYPVSSITEKMTLQLKRRICISNTGQICIRGKPQKEWSPCVEWKDGSTSWEHLANLKESNPVEVADFTTAHGLDTEMQSPDGYRFPSNAETKSSPPSTNAIINGHLNLVSKYQKCTMITSELTKKMGTRFGKMP